MNKHFAMSLILIVSFCFSTGMAFAMPPSGSGQSAEQKFALMDKDKSGSVTWAEFSSAHPNLQRAAFDSIDSSTDGNISLEEWSAFAAKHDMGRKGMPAGHGPAKKGSPEMFMSPKGYKRP